MSEAGAVGENAGRAESLVVVGVDGSPPSVRALHWAAAYAARRGAPLEVVTAWTFPEHAAPLGVVPTVPWPEELVAQAADKLDALVAAEVPPVAGTRVRSRVERGAAGPVLVGAVAAGDLLVVGNRGRSALTEVLFGSVSDYCVRDAPCSVVVVR
jgi:nucleotide-binding universal stress UspA family protein